jgi:hypothetical protein
MLAGHGVIETLEAQFRFGGATVQPGDMLTPTVRLFLPAVEACRNRRAAAGPWRRRRASGRGRGQRRPEQPEGHSRPSVGHRRQGRPFPWPGFRPRRAAMATGDPPQTLSFAALFSRRSARIESVNFPTCCTSPPYLVSYLSSGCQPFVSPSTAKRKLYDNLSSEYVLKYVNLSDLNESYA